MIFTETQLAGAYVIEIEPHHDERGFFARTWCEDEFRNQGLDPVIKQCNISYNPHKGTLRGMHYQADPHGEVKLVRCTMGAIFDVIIDIRPDSPTFKQHFAIELSAENRHMLYIPQGFAHGFQTMTSNVEVFYQMAHSYVPGAGRGVRWNDPQFGIEWPDVGQRVISERDAAYADFED